jgi:hypothetical protein
MTNEIIELSIAECELVAGGSGFITGGGRTDGDGRSGFITGGG